VSQSISNAVNSAISNFKAQNEFKMQKSTISLQDEEKKKKQAEVKLLKQQAANLRTEGKMKEYDALIRKIEAMHYEEDQEIHRITDKAKGLPFLSGIIGQLMTTGKEVQQKVAPGWSRPKRSDTRKSRNSFMMMKKQQAKGK